MTVTRWSPARDLMNLTEEFNRINRLIRNVFGTDETAERPLLKTSWMPPVDIIEDKDNYYLFVELPGLKRDDVKVDYEDGVLTIRGEKKSQREEKDRTYHRLERTFGQFERSFRVPSRIKEDQIDARFENGVLKITLPKVEEVKPREIEIKIS